MKKVHRFGFVLAQVALASVACSSERPTDKSARPLSSVELTFRSDCVDVCSRELPEVPDCGAFCDRALATCVSDPGTGKANVNEACVWGMLGPALHIERPEGLAHCGRDENCDNKDDCNGAPLFVCCGDGDCNGTDDCTGATVSSPTCPATCGDADCDGFDDCATNHLSACVPSEMVSVPPHVRRRGAEQSFTPFAAARETVLTHDVELTGFLIDKTEVTQAAYASCVGAGKCSAPAANFDPAAKPTHPVTNVTWDQAQEYCSFVNKRLPSEAEWEAAARGPKNFLHPWGNQYPEGTMPPCTLGNFRGCNTASLPVGSYPAGASGYGTLDMAGNVSEWVRDSFSSYAHLGGTADVPTSNFSSVLRPVRNPVVRSFDQGYESSWYFSYAPFARDHVFRGGSFSANPHYLIATARDKGAYSKQENWLGFRCARGGTTACVPDTRCPAKALGNACAKIPDGCGGFIDCGPIQGCAAGDTCGGGDYPYLCGCDPDKANCTATSWVNGFQDSGTTYREVRQVVVDSVGNITVAGSMPIPHWGGDHAYMWTQGVSKSGVSRWSSLLGAGSCIYNEGNAQGLALEPGTNAVFAAGYYGVSATGDYKPALVKYSSSGAILWQKYLAAPAAVANPHGKFRSIVRDNNGDVLVYGETQCGWDLGGGMIGSTSKCNWSGVFAKYRGSDGAHLWSLAGPSSVGARNLSSRGAINPAGDLLVANTGLVGAIVRMPNGGGSWSTLKTLAPSRGSSVGLNEIAVDSTGNVFVTGTFTGSVNFGGTTLTSTQASKADMFVAKYGPNMTSLLWIKRSVPSTTVNGSMIRSIALDSLGNPWVIGSGDATWESKQLESASGWLMSLSSSDGSLRVLRQRTTIGALAIDPTDDSLVIGSGMGLGSSGASSDVGVVLGRAYDGGSSDAFVSRTPTPSGIEVCAPRSCKSLGTQCGTITECGATIDCGACAAGKYCASGRCLADSSVCTGKCGMLGTASGVSMYCGDCPSGQMCGAGGVPNVCAAPCFPKTCAELGKNCGTISTCGQTLSCGTCSSPLTCGGGGVSNVCGTGATPAVCGDGVCACTESPTSCASDCKKSNGPASGQFTCGNGVCESAETATKCKADCGGGC